MIENASRQHSLRNFTYR